MDLEPGSPIEDDRIVFIGNCSDVVLEIVYSGRELATAVWNVVPSEPRPDTAEVIFSATSVELGSEFRADLTIG
jgi:hypothetical protein